MAEEHLRIRFSAELLAAIDAACAENGRTRTSEISRRLEKSFWEDEFLEKMERVLLGEMAQRKTLQDAAHSLRAMRAFDC
jgi:hypothetical protein